LTVLPHRIGAALAVMVVVHVATPAMAGDFCFAAAGKRYGIAPELLRAIAWVESNMQPEAVHYNADGSVDYCHMQINSYWKKHLQGNWRYLSDPCYCTIVGAWILKQCILRYGYNWDAVACYHAGRPLSRLGSRRREETRRYLHKVSDALIHLREKEQE